jgi:trigger factor
MKTAIQKLEKSVVEITVTIPTDTVQSYKNKAITRLGQHVEVDGFRKGHAPEAKLLEKIPTMMLLEEMADLAINDTYTKALQEHTLDIIGRPQIRITKIADNESLEYKITVTEFPAITLPEYKKLAKETSHTENIVVTEEDVEHVLTDLRKMRAHEKLHASEAGHTHDHSHHEHDFKEEDLPVADDAFAKSFGEFTSLEEFKAKIKENVTAEKNHEAHQKNRIAILEKIISETTVDVPELLVESEIEKMFHTIKSDIARMGMSFEDYLKHSNKTEEAIRVDMRPDAEKRAKLELVLHGIKEKEKIAPNPEEVEAEVTKMLTYYKDADPVQTKLYVEHMIGNEMVFSFLENVQ